MRWRSINRLPTSNIYRGAALAPGRAAGPGSIAAPMLGTAGPPDFDELLAGDGGPVGPCRNPGRFGIRRNRGLRRVRCRGCFGDLPTSVGGRLRPILRRD